MKISTLLSGLAAVSLTTGSFALAAPAPAAPAVSFADVKAAADALWDRMDANHDGRIDQADHDARLLVHFDKWDTNHDGVISKDEFLAAMHAREHGRGWQRDGAGAPPPPPPPPPAAGAWPHRPGGRVAMAIILPALHEARKDGVMTRAAFDAAVKAGFDRIDTNHDGSLSRDELRAARQAWRHDGHRGGGWRRDRGTPDAPPPPPPPPAAQ